MSIIEEYPGTIAVVRRYVERGLSATTIKQSLGRSVPPKDVDAILSIIESERAEVQAAKRAIEAFKAARLKEAEANHSRKSMSPMQAAIARANKIKADAERLRSQNENWGGVFAFSRILADIMLEFGLTQAEIIGDRKLSVFVVARQKLMFRVREETGYSLPMIGRLIGNRDHTTVLHGIRMHSARSGEPIPKRVKVEKSTRGKSSTH